MFASSLYPLPISLRLYAFNIRIRMKAQSFNKVQAAHITFTAALIEISQEIRTQICSFSLNADNQQMETFR
jgi:hypothetical protein